MELAGFLGSRGLWEKGALQEPQGCLLRSSPCSGLQGVSPASGVDPRVPASCSAWSERFHCSQGYFCCPVLSSFLMWLVQKRPMSCTAALLAPAGRLMRCLGEPDTERARGPACRFDPGFWKPVPSLLFVAPTAGHPPSRLCRLLLPACLVGCGPRGARLGAPTAPGTEGSPRPPTWNVQENFFGIPSDECCSFWSPTPIEGS